MEDNFECFLELDISRYLGEWVAIENKRIIAHNEDLDKLKKEIKGRRPLITKIPKKETMIFF